MKIIVLLLTLICFISCESCRTYSATNPRDCYSIKIEGKKCCFIEQRYNSKGNNIQLKYCDESNGNMNTNKLEESMKRDLPSHITDFKLFVICNENEESNYTPYSTKTVTISPNNSSYLKLGFLLIFCLLF